MLFAVCFCITIPARFGKLPILVPTYHLLVGFQSNPSYSRLCQLVNSLHTVPISGMNEQLLYRRNQSLLLKQEFGNCSEWPTIWQ